MSFSVSEIISFLGQTQASTGRVVNSDSVGAAQGKIRVSRPAPLAGSAQGDLAFFFSKDHQNELIMANPGVLITGEPFVKPLEASENLDCDRLPGSLPGHGGAIREIFRKFIDRWPF